MGVDLYLFDAQQTVRRVLTDGVSRLIHNEAEWLLTADIPMDAQVEPGEFLGFLCIDGAFRLFRIDSAEDNERERTTSIEATDAGVSELAGKVVRSVRLEDADARTAFGAILQGTGWVLGTVTAGRTGKIDVYYQPAWQAMQSVRPIYDARIVVRYELEGNRIAGRVVDVLKKESVFRGRFFDSAVDAEAVYITKSGLPVTVMYGIGKSTSTGDKPDKLTFANVTWSKVGGDPADKPAGQDWIGDPEAIAKYGRIEAVHQNQYQDDPAKLLRETWDELQKASKPTVTVTATVQDMELVPGYEHQSVRIWDRAAVVLRDGTVLDTTVTGIERDYVEPWLTKIKTGDEEHDEPSIAREVAKTNNDLSMLSDRVGGHGAGIEENLEFIVENKEIIRLHTIQIDEQGHAINEAMIELNNGKITLEAHQKKLNEQDELISQAMIEIDGVNARVDIYAAKTDENTGRISSAEIAIDGANAQIALKVSKDGVISSINQTAETIVIQARRIDLSGYVTASQLSAEIANITNSFSNTISTKTLYAQNTFQYQGWTGVWKSGDFVTGVAFPKYQEKTIYYTNSAGVSASMLVLTPTRITNGSVSRSNSYPYLGY